MGDDSNEDNTNEANKYAHIRETFDHIKVIYSSFWTGLTFKEFKESNIDMMVTLTAGGRDERARERVKPSLTSPPVWCAQPHCITDSTIYTLVNPHDVAPTNYITTPTDVTSDAPSCHKITSEVASTIDHHFRVVPEKKRQKFTSCHVLLMAVQ